MPLLLFLALLLAGTGAAQPATESLLYEVYKGSEPIGELRAFRRVENGHTYYRMSSAVTFRVLFEVRLNYLLESTFKNGRLTHSLTHNEMNDRERDRGKVEWQGNRYLVTLNDDDPHPLQHAGIVHNMATIYYEEPQGAIQVYSEKFGVHVPMVPVSAHYFEMVLPDGQKNYYRYEAGRCVEVTCHHTLSTIYFRLRD